MKKIIFSFLFLVLSRGISFAESTATPIQIGTTSITGCPGGQKSCWIPLSTSAPLPATLVITR